MWYAFDVNNRCTYFMADVISVSPIEALQNYPMLAYYKYASGKYCPVLLNLPKSIDALENFDKSMNRVPEHTQSFCDIDIVVNTDV
jgi:hypothetical protein